MRYSISFLIFCLTLFIVINTNGQTPSYDTIKVMSYNTLNYGFSASGDCPSLNTQNKHLSILKLLLIMLNLIYWDW